MQLIKVNHRRKLIGEALGIIFMIVDDVFSILSFSLRLTDDIINVLQRLCTMDHDIRVTSILGVRRQLRNARTSMYTINTHQAGFGHIINLTSPDVAAIINYLKLRKSCSYPTLKTAWNKRVLINHRLTQPLVLKLVQSSYIQTTRLFSRPNLKRICPCCRI
jgi:hypothetical protein